MSYIVDDRKIEFIKSTSLQDRRFCRSLILSVSDCIRQYDNVIIACSAGIDSTVLAHATGQAIRIRPKNTLGQDIKASALYINHNLRPAEVSAEAAHVELINKSWLTYHIEAVNIKVDKGAGLQARAREARYAAFLSVLDKVPMTQQTSLLMAHNASDNAETKLFQFIKGKPALGIPKARLLKHYWLNRPLLGFDREDIERYARCFNLTWCEDSSNEKDDYARNKIRHHMIPWIKENINPGFIGSMNKEN